VDQKWYQLIGIRLKMCQGDSFYNSFILASSFALQRTITEQLIGSNCHVFLTLACFAEHSL
jgi:hypothetical protein